MNTSLQLFSREELSTFKNAELTNIYNKFAESVGFNQIKKFTDKKTAIKRLVKVQDEYMSKVLYSIKTKNNSTKDDTKIHGLIKTDEIQIVPNTKIRKGTILETIADAYDELYVETVEDVINYLVKHSPKNPKRKPMTSAYAAEYLKWYIRKGNIVILGKFCENDNT